MLDACEPHDEAFESQTETCVRNSTESAQVEVPLECLHRQSFVVDTLDEEVDVVFSFGTTHDLAITFRCEYVHTLYIFLIVRVTLHIESLHFCRPVVHHDRAIEQTCEYGLIASTQVAAPLEVAGALQPLRNIGKLFVEVFHLVLQRIDLVLVEIHFALLHATCSDLRFPLCDLFFTLSLFRTKCFEICFQGLNAVLSVHVLLATDDAHGIVVVYTGKRQLHRILQEGGVATKCFQFLLTVFEDVCHHRFDELLDEVHVHIEVIESHLRFYHPELAEVSSRLGFFCTKSRAEGVDLAMCHGERFTI